MLKTLIDLIALAIKYAPAVREAVLGVEAVVGSGNGQTKKELVIGSVLAVVHAGEKAPDGAVPAISGLVDQFVSLFNAKGTFTKQLPLKS